MGDDMMMSERDDGEMAQIANTERRSQLSQVGTEVCN
jgi:hypothetical protein